MERYGEVGLATFDYSNVEPLRQRRNIDRIEAPWLLIGTAINRSIHNDNRSITESGHYICLCKYRIYWYLRRSVWYLCQSSDLFNLLHKSLFQFLLYARTDAMPRKHEVRCPPQKYVKHAVLVLWPRGLVNLFCCCSKKTRCSSAVRGRRIHGTNYILLSDTTECCSSLSSSSNSSLHSSVCKHKVLVPNQVPAVLSVNNHTILTITITGNYRGSQ
jgi:hypothetical protein